MANNDRSDFERFILPEDVMSLKLIFDNLRNTAIIGGLIAVANWVQTGRASEAAVPFFILKDGAAWLFYAATCILFLLNTLQTQAIMGRIARASFRNIDWDGNLRREPLSWIEYVILSPAMVGVLVLFFVLHLLVLNLVAYIGMFAAFGGK
jgi:hypothetical protein